MLEQFIEKVEGFEDENGTIHLVYHIGHQEKNLLKVMITKCIQIVSGATEATCTWWSNIRPYRPFVYFAIGTVGLVYLSIKIRKIFRRQRRIQRKRIRSTVCLGAGTMMFFKSIFDFSENLRENDKKWIPCLGFAIAGYYMAVTSAIRFGRTVYNRTPFFKCSQLLFGPVLIGCANYYLMCVRNHDEHWVHCFPMLASLAVGNHITFFGVRRVESNNEPRWLLFKGLELIVGGSIVCINGAALVIYTANNDFHPLVICFFATTILNGISDISDSLESFQVCLEMEPPVFKCVSGMICGEVVFISAIIGLKFIQNEVMLLTFIITSGIGLFTTGSFALELHEIVPQPVFNRYCLRVLGPFLTMYTSLCSAYIGYHMGWQFSSAMLIFVPAGIYATYRGYN